MLGGLSRINYMHLVFASRVKLDDWEAFGNTGWNYDSVTTKYRIIENFREARLEQEAAGLDSFINEGAHGYGGRPTTASFSPGYTPLQAAWPETIANFGLCPNGDPRNGISSGGYTIPMYLARGISQRSLRAAHSGDPLPADPVCIL